jgi:hypothetical protein
LAVVPSRDEVERAHDGLFPSYFLFLLPFEAGHFNSDESLDAVAATCGGSVTVAAAATPSGASAAAAGSGSPSRRPRSSATVNSDLHHLRHSGDSGDRGVSSPGPPSSEASKQKHSGEEEEEEDADEEDDRGSDNLSYMDRVVMEVVESETVYVRDLQQVVEVLRTFVVFLPSFFVASAASKNKRNFFVSPFCFSHHVQQQL